jgi:hypothetical protein
MIKPKVFANTIDKTIKNNKDVYHYRGVTDEVEMIDESTNVNIKKVLDDIFDSDSFVYKSMVEITLKDKTKFKEEIIAMKETYLITLSNKRINVNDIINIKKAN